jgi:hypothetical protein
MDSPDDTVDRILAALAILPQPEEANAMRVTISRTLKRMSVYRILEIRQHIEREFNAENPEVLATLQMIDGQLALRKIAGLRHWR